MVDFVQVNDLVARRGWLVGLRDALGEDSFDVEIGGQKIVGPMLAGVKRVIGEQIDTDLATNRRLLEELGLEIEGTDGEAAQLPVLKATVAEAKGQTAGRRATAVVFDEYYRR